MAQFKPAYEKTLGIEGGYSCDQNDRGGETYKGISRVNFPNWGGWLIIDHIKENTTRDKLVKALDAESDLQSMVERFYLDYLWIALQLDALEQAIAEEVFDTAVNQGPATSARYLQQTLNLLNNNQKHYSNIAVDGVMGPGTVKAYNAYMLTANFAGRSKDRNIKTLLKALNGLQFQRYAQICEKNEGQEIYLYGWLNRV